MSGASSSLAELQRWLLAGITQPESAEQVAIDAAILPSSQQTSSQRLAVYQHAFLARLLEVLRELFPCTRFAVGAELFDQFAAGYLRRYPPHSYTLGELSDHWTLYLDETRPPDADWGGFVVELARLEHAIDRIFDGPGPEDLPPFHLPPTADGSLRLSLARGFELHAFTFPVSDFFTAWKAGSEPAWPAARPQFVALFRREYVVRRYALNREQFEVLTAIASGRSLADSLQHVVAASPREVQAWFTTWSAAGLFSGERPAQTE
jgi:hypothetical protein